MWKQLFKKVGQFLLGIANVLFVLVLFTILFKVWYALFETIGLF